MASYITNPFKVKRKPKFAPLGLSAITTGLQLGQQFGNMMPDNGVGNFMQGIVDPMNNLGNAMGYLGEGKIGKGLLSMIPGVGNLIAGKDKRDAEAELEAIRKEKANKAYFANRLSGDSAHFNAINNNFAALGKTLKANPSLFPMGGSTSNFMYTPNTRPLNTNADIITNPDGSVGGTHQLGNNIPLLDEQGNPEVVVEPGEVKIDNPDGSVDILSKQLGYAQQYQEYTAKINRLKASISKTLNQFERNAMQRELVGLVKKQEAIVKEQRVLNQLLGNIEDGDMAQQGMMPQEQQMEGQAPMASGGYTTYNPNYIKTNNRNNRNNYANFNNDPFALYTNGQFDFSKANRGFGNIEAPKYNPNGLFGKSLKSGVNTGMDTNFTPMSTPIIPETSIDPKLSFGDKANNFLTGAGGQFATNLFSMGAPIVANVLNRRNMRKAAKDIANQELVPNKINTYTPQLEIGADIAAINSQHADNIKRTDMTSSPQMKNYLANVSGGNRLHQLNQPFQQKARFDTQMKMHNTNQANQVINANIDKENQLSAMKLDSRVGLELSKINQRNMTLDNMYKVLNNSDMKDADKLRVQLLIKQLDRGDGVIDANVQEELNQLFIKLGIIPANNNE